METEKTSRFRFFGFLWRQDGRIFAKRILDKFPPLAYNNVRIQYAAIAQSVERILGKDEVASSNLASSSRKVPKSSDFGAFSLFLRSLWGVV